METVNKNIKGIEETNITDGFQGLKHITDKIEKLEKRLYKQKQSLSRKIRTQQGITSTKGKSPKKQEKINKHKENYKNTTKESKKLQKNKNLKKEESSNSVDDRNLIAKNTKGKKIEQTKNIKKVNLEIQKINLKLKNLRTDYINKIVYVIMQNKFQFITIENLNIIGMMKNHKLSKAIAEMSAGKIKEKLKYKLNDKTAIRMVDRWFPSSKICSHCGEKHTGLKLSDRTFICPVCGFTENRDKNASVNLERCTEYTII